MGHLLAKPTHVLPEIVVTDNGNTVTSEEFEDFLKLDGISHTAPYHPASNGLTVRAMQTFKEGLKKLNEVWRCEFCDF